MCYLYIFVSKKNKLTLVLPPILIQFLLPQYLHAAKQSFDFTPVVSSYTGQQQVFAINMGSVLPGPGASLADLVLYDNHTLHVLFNNQDISYPVVPNLLPTASNPYGIQSAMAFNVGSAADFGGATGISIALDEELVSVVDMNNDGLGDLLTYKEGPINDELKVYLNAGNTFSAPSVISFLHRTWLFHTAELNNNPGALEILGYDDVTGNVYVLNTGNPNQALLNIGPGLLSSGLTFYNGNFCPGAFRDIGYSYGPGGNVYFEVMENPNGSSLTAQPGLTIGPLAASTQLFAGNFNPDNLTDLLTYVPGSGQESVRLNNGNNSFNGGSVWNTLSTSNSFQLHAADFSGDQLTDMLALQVNVVNNPLPSGYGDMYLDINAYVPPPGISSFEENQWAFGAELGFPQNWPCAMLSADFNGDGRQDVLVYNAPEGIIKVGINAPHLEGYCWPISAKNDGNQSIDFFIQGNGQHTVTIHKYTSDNNSVTASPALATYTITPVSRYIPTEASIKANGCQWPQTFSVTIPSNWESGFYAARLVDVFGREDFVTFIVKAATPSCTKVALIANTNTWQAYNRWDGTNLDYNYTGSGSKYSSQDAIYSFMRPCQTARPDVYNYEVLNNDNAYSMLMQRARAELWIYTWLYQNGYEPDVITDQDLHENTGQFINQYAFLIMGTHPEYWTAQMYDHAKQFQQYGAGTHGGNLICLGGNSVFEACDLDLTQATNPRSVFYPTPVAGPGSPFPLASPNANVGGVIGGSPYWNSIANAWWPDRFDYFLEYYLFPDQVPRRSIDLIGTHYNVINNVQENTTSSYTKTALGQSSSIMANVNGSELGTCGYNNGYSLQTGQNAAGKAAGRETDIYGLSAVGVDKMPPSNTQLPSVYSATIQVLARSTNPIYNPTNVSFDNFPNGLNESEIIYVPAEPAPANRGFVFTAGSVTFGGSLVCDANLSQMMHNVMHLDGQLQLSAQNMGCNNSGGSIQASNCISNGNNYVLQPGNLTNSTGYFSGLAAGIYTVTCTDAMGYTQTGTAEIINPATGNFCCGSNANPNSGANLVGMPGMHLLVSPLASAIINQLGNGGSSFITGKLLYIDGVFTVDADISFNNCQFWFTPNAQVLMNGPYQLNFNQCTLQASCDWWGGIVANDPQQKVVIDQCTIRQMQAGIQLSNNPVCLATNSLFSNNINGSIQFLDYDNTQAETKIQNNTFEGDANIKPFNGILIQNCNHIDIGDANAVSSGNLFRDLQNGIEITGNGAIAGILGSTANQIGLYNNTFENIAGTSFPPTYNLIMQEIYGSPKGSGVFIDYSGAPTFDAHTTVSYTGPATSGSELFKNCYKGIISKNNNLIAEKLYLNDCPYGIMNYNFFTKACSIAQNKIEHAHIGTQMAGNYSNYFIQKNDITVTQGIEVSNAGYGLQAFMYPAIGIDIKQSNPPYNANEQFVVDDNTIRIPYYAGKGISNLGANASQSIASNKIFFTVANGTPQPGIAYIDPGLYGVMSTNTKGVKLQSNLVDGQYSLALYNLTFSRGYYFETSNDMVITCNKARATRQGLYAWGDNKTADINIKFNKFRFNRNPLFTLDNGANQQGSFGQIGDGADDNGNDWVYGLSTGQQISWLQNGVFRVWRQGSSQFQNTIYTDAFFLQQSQSGSLAIGVADYLVDNSVNPVADPCPDPTFSNTSEPDNNIVWNNMDVAIADFLAQQQQAYIAYADVGEWWNNRNLYERLSYDSTLLNTSAMLQNFYTNYANSSIHELVASGMGMQALFDFSGDSIALDALYTDALNQNYAATGTTDAELYEQSINEMMLRAARYGVDSLSEVQKAELAFIAHLCPFAAGPAVYKARTLYTLLDPMAQYYDRLMCVQNLGQNKNGDIDYLNLDSLYEAEGDKLGALLLANNGQNTITRSILKEDRPNYIFDDIVKVYPNPTTTTVIIAYRKEADGVFTLYNVLGERILQATLSKLNSKTQIPIQDLANGVYQYEIQFGTESRINGKLNIIK